MYTAGVGDTAFKLTRNLLVRVFEDPAPMLCVNCSTHMNCLGEHATDLCKKGLRWIILNNSMVREIDKGLFKAAEVGYKSPVNKRLLRLEIMPAGILVHPLRDAKSTSYNPSHMYLEPSPMWSRSRVTVKVPRAAIKSNCKLSSFRQYEKFKKLVLNCDKVTLRIKKFRAPKYKSLCLVTHPNYEKTRVILQARW